MIKQVLTDKVILLNTGAITISFLDVEATLKLTLLSISVFYTIIRTYNELCKTKGEKK
jgi:hypothetical protein